MMHFEQIKEKEKVMMKLDDLQQSARLTGQQPEMTGVAEMDDDACEGLDETFYPSEDESTAEDSDSEHGNKRRKRKNPIEQQQEEVRKGAKRSRSSASNEVVQGVVLSHSLLSEDSENSDGAKKTDKKASKKSFSEAEVESIKSSKWWSMTIKELKVELASRSLPVSGVKSELIHRLMVHEQDHPELAMYMDIKIEGAASGKCVPCASAWSSLAN
jgi:hypothetical protein